MYSKNGKETFNFLKSIADINCLRMTRLFTFTPENAAIIDLFYIKIRRSRRFI